MDYKLYTKKSMFSFRLVPQLKLNDTHCSIVETPNPLFEFTQTNIARITL